MNQALEQLTSTFQTHKQWEYAHREITGTIATQSDPLSSNVMSDELLGVHVRSKPEKSARMSESVANNSQAKIAPR